MVTGSGGEGGQHSCGSRSVSLPGPVIRNSLVRSKVAGQEVWPETES